MDRRGVSPVVGMAIMIVIVVILAATVGSMALGFDEKLSDPVPQSSLSISEYDPDGGETTISPTLKFITGQVILPMGRTFSWLTTMATE